jgi:hypothetical protein
VQDHPGVASASWIIRDQVEAGSSGTSGSQVGSAHQELAGITDHQDQVEVQEMVEHQDLLGSTGDRSRSNL